MKRLLLDFLAVWAVTLLVLLAFRPLPGWASVVAIVVFASLAVWLLVRRNKALCDRARHRRGVQSDVDSER